VSTNKDEKYWYALSETVAVTKGPWQRCWLDDTHMHLPSWAPWCGRTTFARHCQAQAFKMNSKVISEHTSDYDVVIKEALNRSAHIWKASGSTHIIKLPIILTPSFPPSTSEQARTILLTNNKSTKHKKHVSSYGQRILHAYLVVNLPCHAVPFMRWVAMTAVVQRQAVLHS